MVCRHQIPGTILGFNTRYNTACKTSMDSTRFLIHVFFSLQLPINCWWLTGIKPFDPHLKTTPTRVLAKVRLVGPDNRDLGVRQIFPSVLYSESLLLRITVFWHSDYRLIQTTDLFRLQTSDSLPDGRP